MTSIPVSQVTSPAMTQSPPPPSNGPSSQGTVIAVVVVLVIVLVIGCVGGIVLWNYFKRRKQSHSFNRRSASRLDSEGEPNTTFRVLSAWEEAMKSTSKTKDVESPSSYPSIQVSYCTPDLIAGTSVSEINQRINANDASIPEVTMSRPDERPRSSEFENPTFDVTLDGILNNSLFNSPIRLDRQFSTEEKGSQHGSQMSSKRSSVGVDAPHFDPHISGGFIDKKSDISPKQDVSEVSHEEVHELAGDDGDYGIDKNSNISISEDVSVVSNEEVHELAGNDGDHRIDKKSDISINEDVSEVSHEEVHELTGDDNGDHGIDKKNDISIKRDVSEVSIEDVHELAGDDGDHRIDKESNVSISYDVSEVSHEGVHELVGGKGDHRIDDHSESEVLVNNSESTDSVRGIVNPGFEDETTEGEIPPTLSEEMGISR